MATHVYRTNIWDFIVYRTNIWDLIEHYLLSNKMLR